MFLESLVLCVSYAFIRSVGVSFVGSRKKKL